MFRSRSIKTGEILNLFHTITGNVYFEKPSSLCQSTNLSNEHLNTVFNNYTAGY